jgi:hypothetical protein
VQDDDFFVFPNRMGFFLEVVLFQEWVKYVMEGKG